MSDHEIALRIQNRSFRTRNAPLSAFTHAGWLMQGPGFANLSSLGLLSDRVVTQFAARKIVCNSEQKIISNLIGGML